MSNRTWACFDCRQSVRRAARYSWNGDRGEDVLCPECRAPCTNLSYKIPLPPRRDVKAWEELRAQLVRERVVALDQSRRMRVQQVHALEKEIADLEARPHDPGREVLLKQLRSRLRGMQEGDSADRDSAGS